MSDKDGGNVSVLNERMMLGWHVANPGHQHQYSLDGKLGDQFAKSAWAALRKLNSASYTIPQVVELMRKNGMPDTSPDKFQAEILSPIEKWGMPDPITTYNLLNELWQRREGVSLIDLYRDQILSGKITPQQAAEKIAVSTALMYAEQAQITSTDTWGGEVARLQHEAMVKMSNDGKSPRFPADIGLLRDKFKRGIIPGITALMADTGAGKSIFRLMVEHAWAKDCGRKVLSAITESSMTFERARRLCQLQKNLSFDDVAWGEWSPAYDKILATPYESGGSVHYVEANGKDLAWLMAVANGKDIVIDLVHDIRYDSFRIPGINDVKAEEMALSALEGYCTKWQAQVFLTVQTDKASRVSSRQGDTVLNAANAKGNSAYEGKARRFLTMQNKYATEAGEVRIEEDDVNLQWRADQRIPMGYMTIQKNRDGGLGRFPYYMVPGMFLLRGIPTLPTGQISKIYDPYLPKTKKL